MIHYIGKSENVGDSKDSPCAYVCPALDKTYLVNKTTLFGGILKMTTFHLNKYFSFQNPQPGSSSPPSRPSTSLDPLSQLSWLLLVRLQIIYNIPNFELWISKIPIHLLSPVSSVITPTSRFVLVQDLCYHRILLVTAGHFGWQ